MRRESAFSARVFFFFLGVGFVFFLRSTTHQSLEKIEPTHSSSRRQPTLDQSFSISTVKSDRDESDLKVLDEILASKNDNDPRLDQDFRVLSNRMKERIRARYRTLPREALSERGLLVFLLGRNLKNEKDFEFFQEVLSEPACTNLGNCSETVDVENQAADEHHGSTNETTLFYPQLHAVMALKKMEGTLGETERFWKDTWRVAELNPSRRIQEALHSEP